VKSKVAGSAVNPTEMASGSAGTDTEDPAEHALASIARAIAATNTRTGITT
jgi:hypothetical protein